MIDEEHALLDVMADCPWFASSLARKATGEMLFQSLSSPSAGSKDCIFRKDMTNFEMTRSKGRETSERSQ